MLPMTIPTAINRYIDIRLFKISTYLCTSMWHVCIEFSSVYRHVKFQHSIININYHVSVFVCLCFIWTVLGVREIFLTKFSKVCIEMFLSKLFKQYHSDSFVHIFPTLSSCYYCNLKQCRFVAVIFCSCCC